MADLLWYPTAGGKTEAYLGLTAFTFALRRLQVDDRYDWSAGTAVLMRYTLRLLTIQQFQRALTLVCASELLRLEDVEKWGEERFTIGLWVGQSVTPNSYEDSKDALDQLKKERRVYGRSPYQVLYCPWCGSDIAPANYVTDDELERTLIKVFGSDCPLALLTQNLDFRLSSLTRRSIAIHRRWSWLLSTNSHRWPGTAAYERCSAESTGIARAMVTSGRGIPSG